MNALNNKQLYTLIAVAALGYFVDIYDLIVFNVVKNESLKALGFSGIELKNSQIYLFNVQMTGMLIGGILWGVLGDKKGRVSVLFGSIFLYSIANVANAFVTSIDQYAFWRFLAGLGLAGELGAGITLVSETMHKTKRGYGTMIIVTFGALGAVVASLVGQSFGWKTTYIIGGCMGLSLLLLRAGAFESTMFKKATENQTIKRGNLLQLLNNRKTLVKYLASIAIGLPVWFVIGVLVNLSDRFAALNNVNIDVADSVMYAYLGLSAGDLLSGLLSQWMKSRKKVVAIYLTSCLVLTIWYLFADIATISGYKIVIFLLGTATGYWALFVTIASEQFGTNIRSTVTNTVPNFVRGAVVPITLCFKMISQYYSINTSAIIVGIICCIVALISCLHIDESFNKELNYFE